MSQHAQYLVREFLEATHWNAWDNHYGTLTQPSRQLLDFAVPVGAVLTTASRPTRSLAPSLTLASLVPARGGDDEQGTSTQPTYPPTPAPTLGAPVDPLLAGQLAYLFTSAPLDHRSSKRAATGADRIDFKDVVQSYPLGHLPVRPDLRDDARPTWHGGRRTVSPDYLLYGRFYAPSPRLDALYIRRFSPTVQGLVSLITVPSPPPPPTLTWESGDPTASLSASTAAAAAGPTSGPLARLSELEVKLQHDTGRWSTEYSYAVGDGMWGLRGLYNFGRWGDPGSANAPAPVSPLAAGGAAGPLEQDEQEQALASTSAAAAAAADTAAASGTGQLDEMPTGLKGRWSAGGELYFSAQERSAGVSTALRFVTIPEQAGGPPNQPPAYVTATLNPIMGQLSTAYAVQAGRDTRFASRFDFNLYSYESELTFGGEWFQRRTPPPPRSAKLGIEGGGGGPSTEEEPPTTSTEFDAFGRGADGEETRKRRLNYDADDEVLSVLKVRASTSSDLAMLWEGRMGDFIVSAGIVADLRLATRSRGRLSPIRSVGLGVSYWG